MARRADAREVRGARWRLAAAALLALAAAPAPEPADAVAATLARAELIVSGEGTRNEKLGALGAAARDLLDTRAMGWSVLGPVLEAQPPEQREEFLDLFGVVIVRAYLRRLLFFRRPEFAIVGARREGDSAVVRTHIVTRKDNYSVDYDLRREGGGWRATDISVEGISLIANYRAQFTSLLRTRSFAEILDLLRGKLPRAAGS